MNSRVLGLASRRDLKAGGEGYRGGRNCMGTGIWSMENSNADYHTSLDCVLRATYLCDCLVWG